MKNNIVGQCNGCGQALGTCVCRFKTIHENAVLLNPLTIDEVFPKQPTLIEVLNNLDKLVLSLQRFDESEQGIVKDNEGEYVLLSDVLSLFSRKN